ncbi:mechanosensitive ion channel protein MscS [Halobacteriales archaeon QH_6_64_20]|jgi:small-conductance mechanosensitive channel|nr:MAG: mechanosensitive ion channel protein MscS [Halobacteriales archaeon QH_6_64_20]
MLVDWDGVLRSLVRQLFAQNNLVFAIVILLIGVLVSYLVGDASRRVLTAVGIVDAVEGTAFERTASRLGTSTVTLLSQLATLFVLGVALLVALNVARLLNARLFWTELTVFLPQVFVAALTVILGLIVADNAEVAINERLRGVKLPEVNLVALFAKYSVLYVAGLIALSQLGVATNALVVLLAAYAFAVVFLGGLAGKDLLASGAAGVYLLLNQPYGIGDEIEVDGHRGIVQEVDVVATRIENDTEEFLIPNHRVLQSGIVRVRN